MDHLQWQHIERDRPRVPYLCQGLDENDVCAKSEDFEHWPLHRGWMIDTDCTAHDLAVLCQKWLFFSLVRLVIEGKGKQFSVQDYVSDQDPTHLCTQKMEWVLDKFERINGLPGVVPVAYDWILKWVRLIDKQSHHTCEWTADVYRVFWSTGLLLELCAGQAGLRTWKPIRVHLPTQTKELASRLNANPFAAQLSEPPPWICPTLRLRRFMTLMESWTLFACFPSWNTNPGISTISHQKCVDKDCKAFGVPGQNFDKQHNSDCAPDQRCPSIGVDEAKLKEIVNKHAIPLVRSTLDLQGLYIDIVDGSHVTDFTAISHVWAGGLGNPSDNDMYECQLMYLHKVVAPTSRLRGSVCYWLDTLCIPVNDVLLRQKAIDEMAYVYASAQRVLVLDPIVRYTNAQDFGSRELRVAILASPWMARSWTLQESALAVKLDFQFRDRSVPHGKLGDALSLEESHFTALWSKDVDRLEENATLKNLSLSEKLWSIWQELSRRNSTKIEDLAAIISIFVDRSAGDILGIRNESDESDKSHLQKRIHTLLRSVQSLPTGLLFAPVYDQTDVWCPRLPSSISKAVLRSSGSIDFTEEGFLQTSDLRDLYLLRSIGPLPSMGRFLVMDQLGSACFEIIFPDTAKASSPHPHGQDDDDFLLVLPRWAVDEAAEDQGREFTGLMFVMEPGTLDAEHARFRRTFSWRPFQDIQASSTHRSTQRHRYPVAQFPPDYDSQVLDQFRLTLDMGVEDWGTLAWSRTKSYPFIRQSVRDAQSLRLISAFSYFVCILFGLKIVALIVVFAVMFDSPSRCPTNEHVARFISSVSIVILGGSGHFLLFILQSRYIKISKRMTLQRIWAVSFSKQPNRGTRNFGIRRIITIAGINCALALLLLSTLPALALHSWYLHSLYGQVNNLTFLDYMYYMFSQVFLTSLPAFRASTTWGDVIKGALQTIFLLYITDAMLRTFVLLSYLWRYRTSDKKAGDHATDFETDPRSQWATWFGVLLAAPIILVLMGGTGIYLLFFLGDIREPVFTFLGTICLIYCCIGLFVCYVFARHGSMTPVMDDNSPVSLRIVDSFLS